VSSDFRLLGPLKEALRGRKFSSDDEVKGSVQECRMAERRIFYSDGITEHNHGSKCIDTQDDYVEE
jgi:hypothetical protein